MENWEGKAIKGKNIMMEKKANKKPSNHEMRLVKEIFHISNDSEMKNKKQK